MLPRCKGRDLKPVGQILLLKFSVKIYGRRETEDGKKVKSGEWKVELEWTEDRGQKS